MVSPRLFIHAGDDLSWGSPPPLVEPFTPAGVCQEAPLVRTPRLKNPVRPRTRSQTDTDGFVRSNAEGDRREREEGKLRKDEGVSCHSSMAAYQPPPALHSASVCMFAECSFIGPPASS